MSQILDVKDAAELLKLHPETVRDMARRGDLIASKTGRVWRIKESDIEAYLKKHSNEGKSCSHT